jgi:carboxyl-terminal processing protease
MAESRRGWRRHALRWTAAALTLLATFLFGFLSGRVGRSDPAGLLDSTLADIRERAANDVPEAELRKGAIEGMLSRLDDPYASYLGGDGYADLQRLLNGRYSGVGLWLGRFGQAVSVVSVAPGSPAAEAGIAVGDEITEVAGASVAGRDVGAVVSMMRGEAGTPVRLVVRRGGSTRVVELRRADLDAEDVTVDRPARDVARIRVAAFTRGVGEAVRVEAGKAADDGVGIVLDLRGNPGGLLDEAVAVASVFLDGGVVTSYRGRGVPAHDLVAERGGDTTSSLVVLVDGGTASAAEVVAAALQERSRAVLVGSTTYGKGSVQQPRRLDDGTGYELTVARYYTPSGRSLDGKGISPDVDVVPTTDGSAALRRAVDVLRGLVASVDPPRG